MGKKYERVPIEPEENLPLFDSHCHLPYGKKPKKDQPSFDSIYDNFISNGGKFLISSTIDWNSLQDTLRFAQDKKYFKMAVGWAPQTVTYTNPSLHEKQLMDWKKWILANSEKFVAIGEIGLDFHHARTIAKREEQIKVFQQIIHDTRELKKPYIIHVRNPSINDIDQTDKSHKYNCSDSVNHIIMEVFNQEKIPFKQIMLHCFSGPPEWTKTFVQNGFKISVPASTFGFRKWRKNIEDAPLESLLTETDSPFQHPYDLGSQNVPMNVKYAIASIASINFLSQQEVANQIIENSVKFFRLD